MWRLLRLGDGDAPRPLLAPPGVLTSEVGDLAEPEGSAGAGSNEEELACAALVLPLVPCFGRSMTRCEDAMAPKHVDRCGWR